MKEIEVVAAIIVAKDAIFATQRGYGEFKDGWEFPGGKIECGESPQEALRREIKEELDTEIKVGALFDIVEYDYPDFHLKMHCFLCEVKTGNLVLKEHKDAKWLQKNTIDSVGWLPADLGLIEKLKKQVFENTENRKCYFAPLEGVTGYIYRNVHRAFFSDIDKYFTPFIVPTQHKKFGPRELRDIMPEHNIGVPVIPQILTNRAEDFITTAKELQQFGYDEVNLNLGCPSRTVVSKGRGSGFLAKQEELNLFLEEIFQELDMKISVKTRIGKEEPEEFYRLLEIFNQYPMEELIIHPRLQRDYYKNKPNLKVFRDALSLSKNPLCYNGDIFSAHDYNQFTKDFPEVNTVMLGRGLIANPGLWGEISGQGVLKKEVFRTFHDVIFEDYREVSSGDHNVLFKMKELWFYMRGIFPDSDKYTKKIKKAERLSDYTDAVTRLLSECEIDSETGYQA